MTVRRGLSGAIRRLGVPLLLLSGLLGAVGLSAASSAGAGSPHRAPVQRRLPTIAGRAAVGLSLRARPGGWSGAASFGYRWRRCNAHGLRCRAIRRARAGKGKRRLPANRYPPTRADVGHTIRVTVTARNRYGRTSATSRATRVVRAAAAPARRGLHVAGNRLAAAGGRPVILRGVDQSGTEYDCSEGYGIFDNGASTAAQSASDASTLAAMRSWGINSVMFGLNEDCWLGINGIKAQLAGRRYINAIKSGVSSAERDGMFPVIAFFWGDPGRDVPTGYDPNGGGQPPLPDSDHAPLFWEEVADTFKSDPNVIFRLQEEPHPGGNGTSLAAWRCWSQGDVQYSMSSDRAYGVAPVPVSSVRHCSEDDTKGAGHPYRTVGMQSLIDIIRGAGAANVIQVPALAYANMTACSSTGSPLSCGFLDSAGGVRVRDPSSRSDPQLMADLDMYPDSGQYCDTVSCYDHTLAPVIARMPLDLGEIGPRGSTDTQANVLLDWMDRRNQSYYAWAWDTWAELIRSYKGAPAAPWGVDYRRRLQRDGTVGSPS